MSVCRTTPRSPRVCPPTSCGSPGSSANCSSEPAPGVGSSSSSTAAAAAAPFSAGAIAAAAAAVGTSRPSCASAHSCTSADASPFHAIAAATSTEPVMKAS